jgi:hypothetical protein
VKTHRFQSVKDERLTSVDTQSGNLGKKKGTLRTYDLESSYSIMMIEFIGVIS